LVSAKPTINRGFGVYLDEGYSSVEVRATQRVPNKLTLPANRFNLISLFVNPPNRQVSTILADIPTVIMNDDEGTVWIPQFSINNIGNWNAERSYYLFHNGDDTIELDVLGRPINLSETPVHLFGNRFNFVPMLYDTPQPVTSVFSGIPVNRIAIIQDDHGKAWIPSLNVNTLGNVEPCK
jgi:hypothetical protein